MKPNDRIIVIAENDHSTIFYHNQYENKEIELIKNPIENQQSQNIAILNWNKYANLILTELDSYLDFSSKITVIVKNQQIIEEYKNTKEYKKLKITVTFKIGDTCSRSTLDKAYLQQYSHVILLSILKSNGDIYKSDSQTLVTLLHVRDINEKTGDSFNIVTQLLNDKNRKLAEVSLNDDFIVSERLISLLISQVAENRFIKQIFNELFSSEGVEIYFKPITRYVNVDNNNNFFTLISAASENNECAIGYKLNEIETNNSNNGLIINPDKYTKIKFTEDDQLIVISKS